MPYFAKRRLSHNSSTSGGTALIKSCVAETPCVATECATAGPELTRARAGEDGKLAGEKPGEVGTLAGEKPGEVGTLAGEKPDEPAMLTGEPFSSNAVVCAGVGAPFTGALLAEEALACSPSSTRWPVAEGGALHILRRSCAHGLAEGARG